MAPTNPGALFFPMKRLSGVEREREIEIVRWTLEGFHRPS